jgi:hypothetical protein
MFFGDAYPYAGALDVVAHEATHGVTHFSCDLLYQDQSGALNEALSDIFGELVEEYAIGSTDWLHGAVLGPGRSSRNLKSPALTQIGNTGYYYPGRMSKYYSRDSPLLQLYDYQDYGGVHFNCTIVSHAFYLLAEGLSGAIGTTDAAKIFYRAQTEHLVQNSQFMDARLACIASAEELFMQGSQQVQKVKEAFDLVELFEQAATPEPPAIPAVSGTDGVLALRIWLIDGRPYLIRRDPSLSDPAVAKWLGNTPATASRPSVSGDGSFACYVSDNNDACFILTDSTSFEDPICTGYGGEVHSITLSPDSTVLALVVLDALGKPMNKIGVATIKQGGEVEDIKIVDLISPATEGVKVNTVKFADAMDISSDNRYLLYDAYNILEFQDGTKIGTWSIYLIDLESGQTFSLLQPITTGQIAYPSFSQTTNHIITFEYHEQATGTSYVFTGNLITGELSLVQTVSNSSAFAVPCFAGDDMAIVYSIPDYWAISTGRSLWRQPLQEDLMSPIGGSTEYLDDAAFGVIYRRGNFVAPAPNVAFSDNSLWFGELSIGDDTSRPFSITNNGTSGLEIISATLGGESISEYSIQGGCSGQLLPPTGICEFKVVFSPKSTGLKDAALIIYSNDPDTPSKQIPLSGSAKQPSMGSILYVDHAGLCNGFAPCYPKIQQAIDSAESPATIFIAQGNYEEAISLNASKALWLRGGFNTSYSSNTSMSMVWGVAISKGNAAFEGIGIQ